MEAKMVSRFATKYLERKRMRGEDLIINYVSDAVQQIQKSGSGSDSSNTCEEDCGYNEEEGKGVGMLTDKKNPGN